MDADRPGSLRPGSPRQPRTSCSPVGVGRIRTLPATFTAARERADGLHPRTLYRWHDEGGVVELSRGIFHRADAPRATYLDLLAALDARRPTVDVDTMVRGLATDPEALVSVVRHVASQGSTIVDGENLPAAFSGVVRDVAAFVDQLVGGSTDTAVRDAAHRTWRPPG